jgi:hypothetical protein
MLRHDTYTDSDPRGKIMVRYLYAWTPLVVGSAIVLLALPWLGLIALMFGTFVTLAALAGLTWAVVALPYVLVRSIGRRWRRRSDADQASAALSLAEHERA